MLSDVDSRDPLPWLSNILWPDQFATITPATNSAPTTDAPTARSAGLGAWWASPTVAQPNILIPADAPRAARIAVRRYHDGLSARRRIRSMAAEAVMANARAARLLLRPKLVVAGPGSRSLPAGSSMGGVVAGISELMDIPGLVVAVSLSTPKSNQKPVLQLLDRSGHCHGWAKVAWNERTEALVETEACWLLRSELDRSCRRPLVTPNLLHDTSIEGRRVVVSSAVEPVRFPRRMPSTPPGPPLFAAVNALGSTDSLPITESPWWRSVQAVLANAMARERRAIEAAVTANIQLRFRIGAWHGDLTPWNLMTAGSAIQVIDWEFAADGVPLGFDLCHFHTQVGSELKGQGAAAALDYSARLTPHGLARLGVEPGNRTGTWQLYLVELLRRLLALRADGYPTDDITLGPAALDRLEHALGLTPGRSETSASSLPSVPIDRLSGPPSTRHQGAGVR